jgi:hypothetical protein
MPFMTPRGLKIRLDPNALELMLVESRGEFDLNSAFDDLHIWIRVPSSMCAVVSLIVAFSTRSVPWTLSAGAAAFALGNIIQQFTYSDILWVVFPMILDHPLIIVPASIACAFYLHSSGESEVAFTQLGIVVGRMIGITEFLLFPLTPVRFLLRRIGLAPPIGDVEFAFLWILNKQATKQGLTLDWEVYGRALSAVPPTPVSS